MQVKIGDKIYDSNEQPILLILEKEDKENISSMIDNNFKYCSFPEKYPIDKIKEFMNKKEDN